MSPDGSIFEGKTLDDAVRKGLDALRLPRAEAMITVLSEGSGGFLGFGARPFKVRVQPRPGGAPREPDDRGGRERDGRRGRRGTERDGGRGGRDGRRPQGEGGRGGRDERRHGGERRREDERPRPGGRPATAGDERRHGGERRRDDDRPRDGREGAGPRESRGPREARGPRDSRGPRETRGQREGGAPRVAREPREAVDRAAPREPGESREAPSPRASQEPREPRGPREERRPRSEREPQPAPAREAAPTPEPFLGTPDAVGPDNGGETDLKRRRRRGRRGGRGRKREPGESVMIPGASTPSFESAEAFEAHEDVDPSAALETTAPREPDPTAGAPVAYDREDSYPDHEAQAPVATRTERAPEGTMSEEALAAEGRRITVEFLQHMGFEAQVEASATGDHVDVVATVSDDEEMLNGRKGETRQALQHILNRMINKGGGSQYHLQLEINDFWKDREAELEAVARALAEEALASNSEALSEYLNSQERRIIHVTLRDDARVKTYALGTGLIKRLAVAPADFPEGPRDGD